MSAPQSRQLGSRDEIFEVKQREEVLNTVLAQVLNARGANASPETIHSEGMPDVIMSFRGLRCALEGKIDDLPNAKSVVTKQATERVDSGISHLSIAIVYPKALRTTPFEDLADALAETAFQFRVCTENGTRQWRVGSADDILDELRRAHEDIIRDDVVQDAVNDLNIGLAGVSAKLVSKPAICDRLMDLLGIGEPEKEAEEE